jgi:hypothetical protein
MSALNAQFSPTITHTRCAKNAYTVTPNDNADLPQLAYHGIIPTTTGVVKVDMIGGGVGITVGVAAGTRLPMQIRRVYSTGNTGGTIVALW